MRLTERPLQDIKVLVTRPQQRAAGLCQLIEQAGGIALQFSAIEISEPADTHSRDYVRDHIEKFNLAIFISPTAVEKTFDYLARLPAGIRLSAIGSKTVAALGSQGLSIDIEPDGHDSEALLEQAELQTEHIDGKKIVIFRGEGGRELLGDTLKSRGADVFYADMYQRSAPPTAGQLNAQLQQTDIITVSSNEGLKNLYDLARDKQDLGAHYLVVPGERGYTLASALGFSRITVAQNATDEACMNALKYIASKLSKKS